MTNFHDKLKMTSLYCSVAKCSIEFTVHKIGHCARHNEETASKAAVLGTPTWSSKSR